MSWKDSEVLQSMYDMKRVFKVIDFNGISTCSGLFYAKRLGNHIHYTFIFTFLHTVLLNMNNF